MDDIIDLSDFPPDTMIITEQMGNCNVCGKYEDLRYGSCLNCADYVMSDGKQAWDIRNPSKKWNVQLH